MADHEEVPIYSGQESKPRQSTASKIRDKMDENHLPTPPPSPWGSQSARTQTEMAQIRNLEDDEDIIAYLSDLGTASEGQTSECPSRNSTTSTMPVTRLYSNEIFEPLSRLYALTEEILELRDRNSKLFRRVRNLEKLKVLRDADRRLENTFARNRYPDVREEDTEFAESLLNAMLSNYREPPFPRRNVRSPSSKQTKSKFTIDKHVSANEMASRAPKISKWTRVKAAFRWERACTNDVETIDTAAPLCASAKYFRIPHGEVRNSSSISGSCDSTEPCGQTSAASSFTEGALNCPQETFSNNLECLSLKTREGKKDHCTSEHSPSIDSDITMLYNEQEYDTEHMNEVDQGKPLIRITSEKNQPMYFSNEMDRKGVGEKMKKPALSLTVTIPSHEDEIKYMSSPESTSPLLSSAHTSGGNSPQPRKTYRELSIAKDFKRQQSVGEESVTLTSRMQKQDSKWNKVRRVFLTNSTLNIPLSPIRVISKQMFFQNDQEAPIDYSYNGSVENLEKITGLNSQTDTQRDYNALREKLGAEFHRKLVEWERLKNLSPRAAGKDMHEVSFSLSNTQENLLSEERLAPEFRKKLQDWKRAKKERRGSAPFEPQRINRRRLTDWQVWRSPLKSEYKSPETMDSRGNCGSGETVFSDGRSRLRDDFVRKVETWKKLNETSNRNIKHSIQSNSSRLGIVSGIDESEFIALEKVLSLFDKSSTNARQLDEYFDCDTRSYPDGTENTNTNKVLIQTSVGSYRFEGISQEFTRKLYDWEKYRGISPRSSTFRLLGSTCIPLVEETNIGIPILTINEIESNERVLSKASTLKRSKSVGSLSIETPASECFVHRAASLSSLNHLTDRLKNTDDNNISPVPIDPQRMEDATKDGIDDSEPEAMIVDIEDVIEETASPLERVQPHQTPVYSVAASETTSIAVPLGTVTSTHKPSSVVLVETEESLRQMYQESVKWNRTNFSSEDSLNTEEFETSSMWSNRKKYYSQDDVDLARSLNKKRYCDNNNFDYMNQDSNEDSIKVDKSIYSTELDEKYKVEEGLKEVTDQIYNDVQRKEISASIFNEGNVAKTTTGDYKFDGTNENESIHRGNLGSRSPFAMSIKTTTDLSSEKKYEEENDGQRVIGDGSGVDGKDVIGAEIQGDSEYEEITPGTIIDPDRHSLTGCNLPELSTHQELGETNHIVCSVNSYYADQVDENFKSRDESNDAAREHHKFEHSTVSSALCTKGCSTHGYHREPTVRTTSLTVSSCREERCFERIVINEETLNKIVVATASNSCPENIKVLKSSTDHSTAKHFTGGHGRRSSVSYETSVDQEMNIKKQCSPTRNVFIKTKRIIFSPFRRTEDHSTCKKENTAFEDDRAFLTKNKSKSRSASPKVNRQDALLRMSFSLPWPLRPSSKDRELKEMVTENDKEEEQTEVDNKRRSSINESRLSQQLQVKQKMQTLGDKGLREEHGRSKYFVRHKENLVDASVQATPDEQQDGASAANNSFILEHEEKKAMLPSRLDTCSSDLMHKLQILSNVVAERDGRSSTVSEKSSLESHFLRIRRAKEDFLSRRGGPLCHTVTETRSVHHYEDFSQDQQDTKDKQILKVGGTSDTLKMEEGEAEAPVSEDAANGLLRSSAVFLPDRVKSASVGMINVDLNTFNRLTESNRGCESLPRTISKQQESSGPLAKIVNKFKFSRLMRGKDIRDGSMSTISRLCRQSLLIDVQNDFEKQWEIKDREE